MDRDTSSSSSKQPEEADDAQALRSELAYVLRGDPEGSARLGEGFSREGLSFTATPSGSVVSVGARRLHSTRDPVKEARRYVRKLDLGQATTVVLLGLGGGFVAQQLVRQFHGQLVVFEPNLAIVEHAVQSGRLPHHAQVVTTPDRLGAMLYELLDSTDQGNLVPWQPSARLDPVAYAEAVRQVKIAIERVRMRSVTTQVRVEGWLDFFLTNLPRLTQDVGLAAFRRQFQDVPCIICSAGPSLEKNVEQLRAVRDRALIIAVNTAAGALARAGIKPHAIISVESLDITPQLENIEWIGEVAAFLELTGNPAVFELPFTHKIPFAVDTSSSSHFAAKVDPGHQLPGGFCVANAATTMAAAMGCSPIILTGQDLAFAEDRMYAQGTYFEDVRIEFAEGESRMQDAESKRRIEDGSTGSIKSGIRQTTRSRAETVPAWGGGPDVTSNKDFLMFRDWFVFAAPALHDRGTRTINATEGGAHIDGWEEMPLRAVIDELGLDRAGTGQTVTERFDERLAQAPTSPRELLDALETERGHLMTLLRAGLEARALVGHDPDGDLMARDTTAQRLATISVAVTEAIGAAPLIREAVTPHLDALRDRQELNTFAIHQAMEPALARLDDRLAALIEKMRARLDSAA